MNGTYLTRPSEEESNFLMAKGRDVSQRSDSIQAGNRIKGEKRNARNWAEVEYEDDLRVTSIGCRPVVAVRSRAPGMGPEGHTVLTFCLPQRS